MAKLYMDLRKKKLRRFVIYNHCFTYLKTFWKSISLFWTRLPPNAKAAELAKNERPRADPNVIPYQ